jgi:hypothetical protein
LDFDTVITLLVGGLFLAVSGSLLAVAWMKITRPQTFDRDDAMFVVKLFSAMGLLPLIFGIVMTLLKNSK